jgi:hypothetical protein
VLGGDVGVMAVQGVAEDRQGHREEAEWGGALDGRLDAVAGLSDAEDVFGVLEAHLDRPPVGVALDQLCGR